MRADEVAVAVLAKQPVPGRSKTRLHPPFSLEEAAELAEAMLADVLDAVAATPAARRVVVLHGEAGGWLPDGFEVLPQRGATHAERIGAAFADLGQPMVLIGMDTPQVTPGSLVRAAEVLAGGAAAVLGPAADGGWWLSGMLEPAAEPFACVPMSRPDTLVQQRRSFSRFGLAWEELEELADVDDAESARLVARQIPGSRFARLLQELSAGRPRAAGR